MAVDANPVWYHTIELAPGALRPATWTRASWPPGCCPPSEKRVRQFQAAFAARA